jgi:hypothetical protein
MTILTHYIPWVNGFSAYFTLHEAKIVQNGSFLASFREFLPVFAKIGEFLASWERLLCLYGLPGQLGGIKRPF